MSTKAERIKLVAATIVILALIILILQNLEPVETRILFARVTMPRAVLLFTTAAIGYVAGLLTRSFVKGASGRKT